MRKTLSLTIVDLTHRDTLMTENATYPIPAGFIDAHITPERYQNLYQQSLDDPDSFWSEQAQILDWHMPWEAVSETDLYTCLLYTSPSPRDLG